MGKTQKNLRGLVIELIAGMTDPIAKDQSMAALQDALGGSRSVKIDTIRQLVNNEIRKQREKVSGNTFSAERLLRQPKTGTMYRDTRLKQLLWFRHETRVLYDIEQNSFVNHLSNLVEISPSDALFKALHGRILAYCVETGQEATVRTMSFYDRDSNLLYVDLFDGRIARLNGQNIKVLPNGTDAVLFRQSELFEPVKTIIKQPTAEDFAAYHRLYLGGDYDSRLRTEEYQFIFQSWIAGAFLETCCPLDRYCSSLEKPAQPRTPWLEQTFDCSSVRV